MGFWGTLFGKKEEEPPRSASAQAETAAAKELPWVSAAPETLPALPGEVMITERGDYKINALKAIRTYTSPNYTLEQAKAVAENLPSVLTVTDVAAFCKALQDCGYAYLVRGQAGGAAPDQAHAPEKVGVPDLGCLMTSQLAALYLDSGEQSFRDEYLRRMRMCGLDDANAERMLRYETEILRAHPRPELLDPAFIKRPLFSLTAPVLDHPVEYYATHFEYPFSYIVKLSDEAEWHFWNSHERDLPEAVWSEIFALADRNRKLFLPFATDLLNRGWTVPAVNQFSYNEQGMLDLQRWGRKISRAAKEPWKKAD